MIKVKLVFSLALYFVLMHLSSAQTNYLQQVRGTVSDAESGIGLPGVSVAITGTGLGAVTDSLGAYVLTRVPIGKVNIRFSMLGYQERILENVTVNSGKQAELNISLAESVIRLHEVAVKSNRDRSKAGNEFATASSRSFSVEEARRYPASFSDPARMVMNFPGVNANGDEHNSVVVRGNSPQGVLWKLEGIEIPNPNHFSALGATGGAVSMLSANMIGRSDFYSGAFPAEIGNATSGAFDLTFRDGNTHAHEKAFMFGTLGAEIAAEGPIAKGKSSYLANYRYSTLALVDGIVDLNGQTPKYQDLAFKIHSGYKRGTFSVFGLGGVNQVSKAIVKDTSEWDGDESNKSELARGKFGVIGLSLRTLLGRSDYIQTVLSASFSQGSYSEDTSDYRNDYGLINILSSSSTDRALRLSSYYHWKISSGQTLRVGVIGHYINYDLAAEKRRDLAPGAPVTLLVGVGDTQFYQAFAQWKMRFWNGLTMTAGLHGSYFSMAKKGSAEPRVSLAYQFADEGILTFAGGLHTKPEHLSVYSFATQRNGVTEFPNRRLDLPRALHTVIGYEKNLKFFNAKLRAEAYFQRLTHVPVSREGTFSTLNMSDVYDLFDTEGLVSSGKGKNYGVDVSIERSLREGFYMMLTSSVFKSKWTNAQGRTFNTRFGRDYSVNFVSGKEWTKQVKHRTFGLNLKILNSGGLRHSEIDVQASVAAGKEIFVKDSYYSQRGPAYFRVDVGSYLKWNKRRATHTLNVEVQNLTNRENYYSSYFDAKAGKVRSEGQVGLLPNLSYKVEFR